MIGQRRHGNALRSYVIALRHTPKCDTGHTAASIVEQIRAELLELTLLLEVRIISTRIILTRCVSE